MTQQHNHEAMEPDILAETDHFAVWRNDEEDELVYHVELGGVTLHFSSEEWDEFATLIKGAA